MTLRLISDNTPEPWHQLADEDEAELALFLIWLMGPRPRPEPEHRQIAMKNDWTERANAYDETTRLPAQPRDRVARIMNDLIAATALETRKFLNKVREDPSTSFTSVRELVTLAAMLGNVPEKVLREMTDESGALDPSELTEEEARAVLETKRAFDRLKKSGRK